MDAGFRTPLLDFFRRGDVARDIRLLAAQGALAPRAFEQLGLLMLLVADHDADVAAAAEATLAIIPRDSLAAFLARTDIPDDMRTFFSARGVAPAAVPAPESDEPIVDAGFELPPAEAQGEQENADEERLSTLNRIAALTVAQKMALAMKGTREERSILIRDPNKIVGVAVLSSPKLTESEVESIAKMSSISDELLRLIAHTRAWVKNYAVVLALTRNPKTPVAISMNLMARLQERDLKLLSTDRNIAEIVRITARKKVVLEKR